MNRQHRNRIVSLGVCAAVLGGLAAGARADTKDELIDRMAKRLPAINQAKAEGKIGETWFGYVEAVKDEHLKDDALKDLVKAENDDRKAFYKLAAKELDTTPEKVALSAGRRNFLAAKPEEWLKIQDGAWVQKKNLKIVTPSK